MQVPKRKDFDLPEFQVETGFGGEMERCRSNVNLTERSGDVFVAFFFHMKSLHAFNRLMYLYQVVDILDTTICRDLY